MAEFLFKTALVMIMLSIVPGIPFSFIADVIEESWFDWLTLGTLCLFPLGVVIGIATAIVLH